MKHLFPFLLCFIIALSGATPLSAQEGAEGDFEFVFMTDIHLQPEHQATEGFLKAIHLVNKINPDFVITGGDLIMDALGQTQSRADSLYELYLKMQKNIKAPVYNTPGNHEHFAFYKKEEIPRTHPDYGDKMFRRHIGKPYYSFNHQGWHFIILNSIVETETRGYKGGIDEEQLLWLAKDLNTIQSATPIVISTHIPLLTSITQYDRGALEPNPAGIVINNSKEVLDLFKDKNLRLVLQGHLHFLEDINVSGKTHFITGGAVSADWWRGPRKGMEEGFVKIKVKGNEFSWEYVDFGWEPTWNDR